MPRLILFLKLAAIAAIAAHLSSCAPAKSYYLLTPEGSAPAGGGMGIGVGPVALAAYLDRPNLVFQEGANRLALAESHRWAGDLEDNIASVIATNLGRRKNTGNVRTYPWGDDSQLRYQVSIDIRQLHGTANGDAFVDAAWRVYSLPDRRMITSKSWSGTEPLRADGYDELAAAQSRLLAKLSTRIADSM
ncbi:PqiC family protein [Haloferula rosea]|uniref:Membrane integrity-associated transporter subunit PqiC n=1 Tax=Haloferula rosea TaxID=490093 RepID=A0A934R702_9BACT|nr:PqiC family protein [Haloferula rosea]MBK1826439.1 membrane integrity-associated transporter subunit PqiC [Haloferula rosea]